MSGGKFFSSKKAAVGFVLLLVILCAASAWTAAAIGYMCLLAYCTSLVVYPAAGLVNYVRNGVPLYLVDPKPIHVGYKYYTQIQDVATAGMRRFLDLVPSLK